MADLAPRYSPQDVEERLYQEWESRGLFRADAADARPRYTIVIPPPNVTGILHMGHALNNTIQDILIRFKRMQGHNALWLPGTDHAGIATQNVVEKQLAKEQLRRQDLGRDKFLKRVWQWKEQYGNTIIYQLKRLGASCDWTRTRFTMDEGLSQAVVDVFVRLYEKGLIYRGNYIINWCPRCQTALADEEAPRKDTHGKLYYIRYPLSDVSSFEFRVSSSESTRNPKFETRNFIVVATTRPETMLGDTAIAVHPNDKRYKRLVGRKAVLPLLKREIPIVADELVDPEFGTGAVKVTPAHDPVDFQLAKRHNLPFLNVMTDDGRMTEVPAPYNGLDRFECRKAVVAALEEHTLLEKVADHPHAVGHCYRCDTVVEPRLSLQWFVKMKPLAAPAIEAVKKKQITFTPSRWTKVYLNWMENIQDWCISRQIWWGHRIPVWYCDNEECQEIIDVNKAPSGHITVGRYQIVSKNRPEQCNKCGNKNLRQDEDVLDTWFSSWLWPFSTLGWPQKTKDLEVFYPTSTLVTAPEIIFFWVARMIMAGYFCMGKPPFEKVYIHGTVRDLTGKKMSKSLGNIIDPLEIIKQYGTDALRYTLITSTAIGTDVFISEEKFTLGRNFANKLWNATRYVLTTVTSFKLQVSSSVNLKPETWNLELSVADKWILSRLQQTITDVTKALDRFAFNEAARLIYDFIWRDYCDWYLEISKIQLAQKAEGGRQKAEFDATPAVLVHALDASLRLLHPIMPFVTEELWQHLQETIQGSRFKVQSLMVSHWPKTEKKLVKKDIEAQFELLQAVVTAIRNTKAELNVPAGTRPAVQLSAKQGNAVAFFEAQRPVLQALAQVGDVTVGQNLARARQAAATVVDGVEVIMPLAGLIDVGKERQRIEGRVQELREELARLEAKLDDAQFTQRAPKEVVEQIRTRRVEVAETLKKFSSHLELLQVL